MSANPATTATDSPALLDMDEVRIDPAFALRVPPNLAMRRQMLPIASLDGCVLVACANVNDASGLRAIQRHLQSSVRAEAAEPESLRRALGNVYGGLERSGGAALRSQSIDRRAASIDLEPDTAVDVADELLYAAIIRRASDIHIDPSEESVRARLRVDGELEEYREFPRSVHSQLISRLKVLSGLDIAEKRVPQDGGFRHTTGQSGAAYDVRVATLPTKHGERMTLRLLALQTESLTLERLGMNAEHLTKFSEAIRKPHGLILLTGPTGSGKTTTLYAAIREIMGARALNIVTIEDPIEYDIPGVAQVEVDTADKVNFKKALRSTLRHDPDVVMIGEIRDAETADVAIKAALTGHLVFSTLHTNSAAGAVTRLIDMGVPRYLVAATLRLAVAQRLVKRLCDRCKQQDTLTEAQAASLHRPNDAGQPVWEPNGCIYCANRGRVGRLAIFEMLTLDETWSKHVAAGMDEAEITEQMRKQREPFLVDDAARKMFKGITTYQDVMSAITVW